MATASAFLAASALFAQVPASVYNQAVADFGQQRYAEAEQALRPALAEHPHDTRALGLMGVILDAQKRFAEAETFYRRALALDPNSASLYSNLGNHYLKQGQTEKARAAYLRVVAFDPADRNANSQLAQISVISGISVSPQRQHLGLYYLLYFDNLGQEEVCRFLRELLRHLRGSVIVLLDNSSTHYGEPLAKLLRRHPRLHIEHFPAYAPELNPDEGVWSLAKRELANGCPLDVDELMDDIIGSINGLRTSPEKLRGCILQSDLPNFLS